MTSAGTPSSWAGAVGASGVQILKVNPSCGRLYHGERGQKDEARKNLAGDERKDPSEEEKGEEGEVGLCPPARSDGFGHS
jgi:hypothetical protein